MYRLDYNIPEAGRDDNRPSAKRRRAFPASRLGSGRRLPASRDKPHKPAQFGRHAGPSILVLFFLQLGGSAVHHGEASRCEEGSVWRGAGALVYWPLFIVLILSALLGTLFAFGAASMQNPAAPGRHPTLK